VSDLAAPPPALLRSGWLPLIRVFFDRAVALSRRLPVWQVTSWFRTAERNRIEGGSAESQHLLALAMDFDIPASQMQPDIQLAFSSGLIGVSSGRTILHVQLFPAGALARAGVTFPR